MNFIMVFASADFIIADLANRFRVVSLDGGLEKKIIVHLNHSCLPSDGILSSNQPASLVSMLLSMTMRFHIRSMPLSSLHSCSHHSTRRESHSCTTSK